MRLSEEKKKKISEQILSLLFEKSPRLLFTSEIASELARDEEFIKKILHDLSKKNLVVKILKNPQGISYSRRQRWRLSSEVHEYYSKQEKDKHLSHNKFEYSEE